jgi:hypothetical protein
MKRIHHRHQILESLDSMDQTQTEKVLDFIKRMQSYPPQETAQQVLKREALKQIRQALRENRLAA